ncbi:acyloxyacyl hydrolase [Oxalobacteraceae bacterium]|nr:acyloxyacyl hydrolase [Oxalobacteraceae bacterium]
MFAKKCMVLAAAWFAAQAAFAADDKLIDSVSLDFATGSKIQMMRVGVQKDWDARWFQSNGTHLSGYWDASAAYWRGTQANNIPGAHMHLTDLGFTPVFRFQNDTKKGLYYEAGIGVHRLSDLYNNDDNRLSTRFQFGDHLALGYVFANRWEVAAQIQHFSNGGYKKPNSGVNFLAVKAAYHF